MKNESTISTPVPLSKKNSLLINKSKKSTPSWVKDLLESKKEQMQLIKDNYASLNMR